MSTKKTKILNDINYSKNLKYNWHEDPYSYYKLAKEFDLPYNLYEIFSSNIIDPQDEEQNNKKFNNNNSNNNLEQKKITKPKINIPIIETIILENGQITGWIYNDKNGNVAKKPLKKLSTDNIIHYFLNKIKNYYVNGEKLFKNIPENKILIDLPKFATYILQKKENRDEKLFKKNNLEYIKEMEKIKFILIYYYSQREPLLIDFINFYFLINEHGGINSIKMIQNCLNCKLKNISNITSLPLKSSFNKKNTGNLSNEENISDKHLRLITVKYSKPNELEQKKYYVFYEKPKINLPIFNNNILNNLFTTYNYKNFSPTYNYPNSVNKYKTKYKTNEKIFINAEPRNKNDLIVENEIENTTTTKKYSVVEPSKSNIQEKVNVLKKNKINKLENINILDESFENKFKYLLKGGKKNDGKILGRMEKIEENLILQNNEILNVILSNISERLIKYIEKTKNIIILYAYFIFVRISNNNITNDDGFYAFQKCMLLYGIDKNEGPVIEKSYLLKENMKNIIYKRIPEDVNKFKNFEKFTKNDFCHGEFCNYIVPNYFKGIKEQHFPKNNLKIPKENKISIRGKNNELPGKMPLFEIKKVYDNPELTNLVLKAYSIFPPTFNKESAIERLVKERNKKIFIKNEAKNNDNNNDDEDSKKNNIKNLEDEYGSIMDSTEKICDKINEYENEFKQEIIVYTPTPGKFLHVDYNDMYTEKGVCEKCYKIYTIILEFMRNIDECTAEFKSLIKAKQFLIKGENLRINNFEDKNNNDNNLIIQEELGKMSVKKFLGIKILKLRLEELNKFKKKQKIRIERNLVTQKQELNKTFNYNLNINLKLLLANLLAEKTNNQFFSVLFNELYNEDDTIYKHLDIKKPKIAFEKTNMKDLRLQMGISSLTYSPNLISNNNKIGERKSIINHMIKNNLEKQKNNQILKNIQQQIYQVDKNLFQEYRLLCGLDNDSNNNINNENVSYDKDFDAEKSEIKINEKFDKNKIIDNIFEYYTIPSINRKRISSVNKKRRGKNKNHYNLNISDENMIRRNNSIKNLQINGLLKKYIIKKSAKRKKELLLKKEAQRNMYNIIQIKSLEEIKKQKEKQLDEFLRFDPKKFHRKKNNKNIKDNINQSYNSIYSNNSNDDSENKSKNGKNQLALLFEDENWEYYDSQDNTSEKDMSKWDKNKVVISSLFYTKTSKDFQNINSIPYYYITTPFPKLKDFNSTQRINENPLEVLRKINFEQFSSLGNFAEDNLNDDTDFNSELNLDNKITKNKIDSKNAKIYADDNSTAIPYEILDYNNTDESNVKDNKNNNINNKNIKGKKKYIVFVINDFFDTYVKYRYFFNLVLLKLKCYQNLSINNNDNNNKENIKIKNKNKKELKNNPLILINSNIYKNSTHEIFIKKPINILTTKNSTFSKEKEKERVINTNNNYIEKNDDESGKEINKDNIIYNKEINNENNKENDKISKLKFVLFNLPGQSTTLFAKKVIQNNIYYSEFLDRFIYYLYKEKEFDLSYKIILLGFGNGGHIALTYASLYEKYWNILDSIIMFNSYCKNGPIVNETMVELLKLVTKENNPKTIEFFIKQSTHNPKEFISRDNEIKENNKKNKKKIKNFYGFDDEYIELQKKIRKIDILNDDNNNNKKDNKSYNKTNYKIKNYINNDNILNEQNSNEDIENNITLDGYKTITKGYFFNIQINLKEINTKILCIHSNVDSFINIHNISPLFDNDISSYNITPIKELFYFSFKNNNEDNFNKINYVINKTNYNQKEKIYLENKKNYFNNKDKINKVMGYNLSDFKNQENNTRKLIIFDGSHDVTYPSDNKENIICTTLISYFN